MWRIMHVLSGTIIVPAMIVQASKRYEFDTAHRLPNHNGLCRNVHGHRYALEVTVQSDVSKEPGAPDEGMVIDFKELGAIIQGDIVKRWDHMLLLHKDDPLIHESSSLMAQQILKTETIPTAENMAMEAFKILEAKLVDRKSLRKVTLVRVRLYETPTAWVDVCA